MMYWSMTAILDCSRMELKFPDTIFPRGVSPRAHLGFAQKAKENHCPCFVLSTLGSGSWRAIETDCQSSDPGCIISSGVETVP